MLSIRTTSASRSRWAAIGAAVAVSLGAGGLGLAAATGPDGAVAFVPITPCRLIDTRPGIDTVGARATPLGKAETITLGAHGANGDCAGIPSGATGLSLNVTTTNASKPTFLTIWPADASRPTASSLNPQGGEPARPNAVTTKLSPTGQFSMYNLDGTVNVIVDVNGYYIDHDHDDRTLPTVAAGSIGADATIGGASGVAAVAASATGVYQITLAAGAYVPAQMVATVTSACAGVTASVTVGTGDALQVDLVDEAGAPAACGFSFTVTALPAPTTTTTSTTTSTTTVAPTSTSTTTSTTTAAP